MVDAGVLGERPFEALLVGLDHVHRVDIRVVEPHRDEGSSEAQPGDDDFEPFVFHDALLKDYAGR